MADSKDTYRTVTPYLLVPDADAELAFLKAAFGGTEANCQRNADNTVMHAEIKIGDSLVMLGQAGGPWKPRSRRRCTCGWTTSTPRTHERFRPERRPKASPKTSRTGTETPASSIRTASPGGSALQSGNNEPRLYEISELDRCHRAIVCHLV